MSGAYIDMMWSGLSLNLKSAICRCDTRCSLCCFHTFHVEIGRPPMSLLCVCFCHYRKDVILASRIPFPSLPCFRNCTYVDVMVVQLLEDLLFFVVEGSDIPAGYAQLFLFPSRLPIRWRDRFPSCPSVIRGYVSSIMSLGRLVLFQ